jgi:hypothetical protein
VGLSDQTRQGPNGKLNDVVFDTLGGVVVRTLSKMNVADFQHPDYRMQIIIQKQDVEQWRTWWRENKAIFVEKAREEESAAPAAP